MILTKDKLFFNSQNLSTPDKHFIAPSVVNTLDWGKQSSC